MSSAIRPIRHLLVLALAVLVSACAITPPKPAAVEEIRPGLLKGYLAPESLPNSLALLRPAPAAGGAAQQLDEQLNAHLLTLQDSPRFELASLDNDLSFPNAAGTFSCALGVPISDAATPFLYQLLRRSLADAGLATYTAKNHYQRTRPFVANGAPNCAAEREQEMLAHDGSYPSGHTAIGWAWALILAELAPERANRIFARGLAYGDSRAVCNVHWPSDLVAGRVVGAATVAVLHADPVFQQDFEQARREVAASRASGSAPSRDCAAEAAALAIPLWPGQPTN